MCPQCKEIFRVWSRGTKTPEEVELLSREVPERFTEVHKYFDRKQGTVVYVMECNNCGQAYHVSH